VRLLIAGAGGHGRVVADAAAEAGAWKEIAFLDDKYPGVLRASDWPVVGTLGDLARLAPGFEGFIAAFGDARLRLRVLQSARQCGVKIATIVHPRAVVSARVSLGEGTVIFGGAVVNTEARVGIGCIVNAGATIDHDCVLGDGVHVCPGVHLAGGVKAGECAWLGIGCCVIQDITVGDHATIGAGAVVIREVAAGTSVVGNPARVLRHE
jgi:sugar O-acyltransferase (sialic acid O-acetyltransferase NeuD family)